MKSYLVKTPKVVQWLFPKRLWAFPNTDNHIYLSFDDGPIPDVTPWVLAELKKHQAKATFFCIGDNVQKHPKIFKQITSEGHAVGNHTYHHLNGRKTAVKQYVKNVNLAQAEMLNQVHYKTQSDSVEKKLFRPPFGRMTSAQAKALHKIGYKIVMWDVLSADFDMSISEEKCLQNVLKNIDSGSVVVFHDSLKAEKKLRYVLPKVLQFISEKGWTCEALR